MKHKKISIDKLFVWVNTLNDILINQYSSYNKNKIKLNQYKYGSYNYKECLLLQDYLGESINNLEDIKSFILDFIESEIE